MVQKGVGREGHVQGATGPKRGLSQRQRAKRGAEGLVSSAEGVRSTS